MKKNADARIQQLVSNMDHSKIEATVETETILTSANEPSKKVKIGSGLEATFKEERVSIIQGYSDIFAWSPRDMPGIDESITMHSLDVNPERKLVKQKRRNLAPERQKAIDEEIEKLLKAGIKCEVKYPKWLENVIMVKKANGKWRMSTNNQVEYEALIAGLKLSKALRIQNLKIYSDFQILVKQINGEYIAKNPVLAKPGLLRLLRRVTKTKHKIRRGHGNRQQPELDDSIYQLLGEGRAPGRQREGSKVKSQGTKILHRRRDTLSSDLFVSILKCIGPGEAQYYLMEVHEGICGDHMSAKALAHKIIRQGYYWPTIHQDAIDFVKKYKECQLFSNITRTSPVLPSSVLSPIPFAVWGIDIMGPFPRAREDLRYLLVSIDYMTKWVEAKAMRTINQQDCIKFMDNILMRFGIPSVLVSDNGPQFVGAEFESYIQVRGIRHKKSSVTYPQGNGQVEVTNRILLRGIKKRLRESKTKWPEELPNVLWAYRTSPRISTGETPFKLDNGTKAMLPIEAVARMEKYKEKTKEHYSKKSRVKNFQVGDLVLQDMEASDPTNTGKLMPRWEGLYKIKEVLRPGTYKLTNMDKSEIPNTWHGLMLRKFYQ
ncbi:uncharacterized protein LOC141674249 [Apium graveolens]|uniref:uncharacterized protein LOC141674249 n=1 Tax=Apium graveolens TaxID=4045 RepID=UPI003D79948F